MCGSKVHSAHLTADFDQHLECIAPKRWSKNTTSTFCFMEKNSKTHLYKNKHESSYSALVIKGECEKKNFSTKNKNNFFLGLTLS